MRTDVRGFPEKTASAAIYHVLTLETHSATRRIFSRSVSIRAQKGSHVGLMPRD